MLPVLIETLGQSDGDMRWAAESILVEFARRSHETRDALVKLAAVNALEVLSGEPRGSDSEGRES